MRNFVLSFTNWLHLVYKHYYIVISIAIQFIQWLSTLSWMYKW